MAAPVGAEIPTRQPIIPSVVERVFQERAAAGFTGAVLVRQGEGRLFSRAYGVVNERTREPATLDTVFDIGSITKQFTATAILRLERAGRLNVRDPLKKHFPSVPPDKATITIHQLLTHSSGLLELIADDRDVLTKEQAVSRIFASKLVFRPGTATGYSNAAYTILAAIIEQASGQPYLRYMQEHLLGPAGLDKTGDFSDPKFDAMRLATGYLLGREQGVPSSWAGPTWSTIGNGEFLSTLDDLEKWFLRLRSGGVVPLPDVTRLWYPHIVEPGGRLRAYGWRPSTTALGPTLSCSGGGAGGNATLAYYPEHDLLVIIMSNKFRVPGRKGRRGERGPAEAARTALEGRISAALRQDGGMARRGGEGPAT